MKKMLPLIIIVVVLAVGSLLLLKYQNSRKNEALEQPENIATQDEEHRTPLQPEAENEEPDPNPSPSAKRDEAMLANPASSYCISQGKEVEIVTNKDGSQFGICHIDDMTACEEWLYMRGECTLEADQNLIKEALVAMGRNMTSSKVVISKHMGKYIEGTVTPVEEGIGGGGYVYVVKENGAVKVLADGNGAIMCSSFQDYPDLPGYILPSCLDANGNEVGR